MDISSIRLIPSPLTVGETQFKNTWQTGEILEATVVTSQAGHLTLKLGDTQIQAKSNLQFSPGQHLHLQVSELGELPVLRLLNEVSVATPAQIQGRTLRMALPQRGSLTPVLKDLLRLAQSTPEGAKNPHPTLSTLATAMLAHLPQVSNLEHPEGLKQAIRESGLFLESHLATLSSGTSPSTDLKADLLRLEAAARATPPSQSSPSVEENLAVLVDKIDSAADHLFSPESVKSFLHTIQRALAGVEVNQMNLIDGGILALELPIRRGNEVDTVALVVEEGEESSDGRGGVQRPWTATLRFDLKGLGAVWTRITVTREVSVLFQTERADASQTLGTWLDTLRATLVEAGLNPGRLSAQTGPLPPLPRRKPSIPLLDERA
ncbi:conserved hypothetical protein [Gammaproteobacteria bacterium]